MSVTAHFLCIVIFRWLWLYVQRSMILAVHGDQISDLAAACFFYPRFCSYWSATLLTSAVPAIFRNRPSSQLHFLSAFWAVFDHGLLWALPSTRTHTHVIHHVSTVHTINTINTINTIKKINMANTWRALCGYFFNSIQYVVPAENVTRFRFHTVQRFHIMILC